MSDSITDTIYDGLWIISQLQIDGAMRIEVLSFKSQS